MIGFGEEERLATMMHRATVEAVKKRLGQQMRFESRLFAPSNLEVQTMYDVAANQVVVNWMLYLLGCKMWEHVEQTVDYPATWRDAFKVRWFPQWTRKWLPVHYTKVQRRVEHWHVCPHMAIPDHKDHISFLSERY